MGKRLLSSSTMSMAMLSNFVASRLNQPSTDAVTYDQISIVYALRVSWPLSPGERGELVTTIASPTYAEISFSGSPAPHDRGSLEIASTLKGLQGELVSELPGSGYTLDVLFPSIFAVLSVLPQGTGKEVDVDDEDTPGIVTMVFEPFFVFTNF